MPISKLPDINNHFFLPGDRSLFDYDQIFSVSSLWVELGMDDVEATFDLLVRGMPQHRNFLLFGGLEEIITGILNWRFSAGEVAYLVKNKIITPKTGRLMRDFKFKGDIWAMSEGSIFFPNEPVLRITGKMWQVNLFTFFLMNALTSNTIYLSKIARSILAGQNKIKVVTCPVTRAHSNESSLKFGRAAYLLGAPSNIVPAFARKYNLPMSKVNTKAYHAFIQSFPTELGAMRAAVKIFPTIGLMVDTYNLKQGIANAITAALESRAKGGQIISAVIIDSGKDAADFVRQAKYARERLDAAGLTQVKVNVSGNFDEYKIATLVKAKAPINGVVACTDLVTVSDDPKLEAVFKLAEFNQSGETRYSAKFSPGKISYPGKKHVFRVSRGGFIKSDEIAPANERRQGEPLLKKFVSRGRLVRPLPSLDQLKDYTMRSLSSLPPSLKRLDREFNYPVKISPRLTQLLKQVKKERIVKN